tara:strand:+ start:196 stop:573 length:378 start_codon:yes stop_codon:yes gene_type:complete
MINVTINNTNYQLNETQAIECGCLKEVKPEVFRKIGEYYMLGSDSYQFDSAGHHIDSNSYYILTQVDSAMVCLINIGDCGGNRFADPVKVKDVNAITEDEWNLITTDIDYGKFNKVKIKITKQYY